MFCISRGWFQPAGMDSQLVRPACGNLKLPPLFLPCGFLAAGESSVAHESQVFPAVVLPFLGGWKRLLCSLELTPLSSEVKAVLQRRNLLLWLRSRKLEMLQRVVSVMGPRLQASAGWQPVFW